MTPTIPNQEIITLVRKKTVHRHFLQMLFNMVKVKLKIIAKCPKQALIDAIISH